MASTPDIPTIERPLFFDGQRLTADDTDAVVSYDRDLRWLHNRSLHGWGVARGYSVTGAAGATSVTVGPGYALDCLGRELVLSQELTLAVPPVAAPTTYFLAAAYAEDDTLTPETRAGDCGGDGAVRLPNDAVVRWTTRPDPGIDVVLGSASVQHCALKVAFSSSGRNDLRGEQPFVSAGSTQAGATEWRLWPDDVQPVGVATTVETTAAGFETTPVYQASVVGERELDQATVLDGYARVANAGPASFDLCVTMPSGTNGAQPLNPSLDATLPATLRDDLGWYVVWIGVAT